MLKRALLLSLALLLCLTAAQAEDLSLDGLMAEIEEEIKSVAIGDLTFEVSVDRQSIYIDRPQVTGPAEYTIAYNIYDADSNPVNYFYSPEERVAATPGYGGLFNVFVVVTDTAAGEQAVKNIGWTELSWPRADRLTVGKATFEVSPDRKSIFVDRPSIQCKSGKVTIAYNIYDAQSQPVNYFYSTQKRVAATPGYDGRFNVFIVVTDTETGEQNVQNIGWTQLGEDPQPTGEPTAEPTAEPTPFDYRYSAADGQVTIDEYLGTESVIEIPSEIEGMPVVAIGDEAFKGNEYPEQVTIPDSVTLIGASAFAECPWLNSVSMGYSVTEIGANAFYGCSMLKQITISTGLVVIEEGTFARCTRLTSVTIPSNVTCIGASAFEMSGLTSIVIGNNVLSVDERAFRQCESLTSVTFPDSVVNIGNSAFSFCKSLTSVTMGKGVTLIDEDAFSQCKSLTSVKFGNSVESIGKRAFHECDGLTSVTFPDNVTDIGEYAFGYCDKLAKVTFGQSVARVGERAFEGCVGLTSVNFGKSTPSIGSMAFTSCDKISKIYVSSIKSWLSVQFADETSRPNFDHDGKRKVHLYIGNTELKDVTIPAGITEIDDYAFAQCVGLTSVTIPDSVTDLGFAAFENCTGLTRAVTGNRLFIIPEYAFSGCTGLKSITFGKGVSDIYENAFKGCTGISEIHIASLDSWLVTRFFNTYSHPCNAVKQARYFIEGTEVKDLVIPGGDFFGTSIPDYAFYRCAGLTSVRLESGCNWIGDYAFCECASLTKVTIPDSMLFIDKGAFQGCTSLTSILFTGSEQEWSEVRIESGAIPDGVSITFGIVSPT